jgi:membrane protein implicated in regulation of membrane protease activity
MNRSCPACGTVFYRESGYFLGAMVLSYFAGSGIGILCLLVLFAAFKVDIITSAIVAVGIVLGLTPLLYRYSRIAWIHLDQTADPEGPAQP